jgi:enoyl-CoA hydratase/carnithine racemase
MVEATVGLTPAADGTQRRAQLSGIARAKEIVVLGEVASAQQCRPGLLHCVVPDEHLLAEARAVADILAGGLTRAHEATKAVLGVWCAQGMPAADAYTPAVTPSQITN